MNTENIHQLTAALIKAGFDPSIGYRLIRCICFQPANFWLTERVEQEKDIVNCSLYFERRDDSYHCVYYDAVLLKSIPLAGITIDGIPLAQLEKRMAAISWEASKESPDRFRLSDETTWANEREISAIVSDLHLLSASEEGRYYSDYLKNSFWPSSQTPVFANARQKISQRFYFFEGEGISTSEAYRFLVNQWLERNLKERRKQPATTSEEKNEGVKANLKKRGRRPTKK